uniref:Uncharacterized protein n=1 Tax=Parascaris univalens TaxID=6257 RepID=A0A915B092_PARUN
STGLQCAGQSSLARSTNHFQPASLFINKSDDQRTMQRLRNKVEGGRERSAMELKASGVITRYIT